MFSNFGFGEIAVLAVFAMLVFGPEKLPRAALDAARVIKKLRSMADVAVSDFKSELPPGMADVDLRSMDPRRIVSDALFSSDRPLDAPEPPERVRPVATAPAGDREPGSGGLE